MFRTTFAAVIAFCGLVASALAGPDEEAVRHLLKATFDKPEARLGVDPVVVSGDHAIAGWSQGDMGGRALLRRKGAGWIIVLCAGDDLKSADVLHKVGLPHDAAKGLADRLADAEKSVAPERLALFSTFEGLVMVAPDNAHHGGNAQSGHGSHGHK